jgi:hypothetical protein
MPTEIASNDILGNKNPPQDAGLPKKGFNALVSPSLFRRAADLGRAASDPLRPKYGWAYLISFAYNLRSCASVEV